MLQQKAVASGKFTAEKLKVLWACSAADPAGEDKVRSRSPDRLTACPEARMPRPGVRNR